MSWPDALNRRRNSGTTEVLNRPRPLSPSLAASTQGKRYPIYPVRTRSLRMSGRTPTTPPGQAAAGALPSVVLLTASSGRNLVRTTVLSSPSVQENCLPASEPFCAAPPCSTCGLRNQPTRHGPWRHAPGNSCSERTDRNAECGEECGWMPSSWEMQSLQVFMHWFQAFTILNWYENSPGTALKGPLGLQEWGKRKLGQLHPCL